MLRDFVYSLNNQITSEIVFRKFLLYSPLLLTIIFSGCQRKSDAPDMVEAHHLTYEIEYLEEKVGDIPTKVLPGTMDAYYTKHHVYTRISGFFNQFTLVQIADLRRKKVTTLLDFFATHVYYTSESGDFPAGVVIPENMELRFTDDTATIGGFLSERIEVKTEEGSFDIYATRDLKIRRPNMSTPYWNVDDPLTAFRIQLSQLKMQLNCSGSELISVDSETFTIPDTYKAVNRAGMEQIINNLFTKD